MKCPLQLKPNVDRYSTLAKEGVPIQITLEEIGHPQPATPIQVDNSTDKISILCEKNSIHG